ncbi:MAG: flagellar hook-associated protein FlgK [Phycisphaerales bacterium]|nr:MAG: flagellar hook-associated protein FlgK [Phycisphaerales bacterium]
MGLLNSALQIGRSALLTYQSALQVVGSNVSSAGSPDYTRLSPELASLQGRLGAGELQPGAGVALDGIQRHIDEALESRIRLAVGSEQSASTQQTTLAQVEALIDDISGVDVSTRLGEFFNTFDEVQNRPENTAIRDLAITSGVQLAASLHNLREQLASLGESLDGQIAELVVDADDLAQRIARVNTEITTSEAGPNGQATGLRDQRDALLRELSELVDLTVREQPNGALNVYIGSEALVQGNVARDLVAVSATDGEVTRTSIRFADTNAQVDVRAGRLAGLISSRDEHAYDRIADVDELAAAVIVEVNRVHADGQGVVGFTSLTGSQDLLATDVPLDDSAAGLGVMPRNGSFYMTVVDDQTNTPIAYRIDVELGAQEQGTTLEALVADVNAQVEGVTASITSDNKISFTAIEGVTFTFGHDGQVARADTSNILAALGVNTFFSGTSAEDISVSAALVEQPALLAASSSFIVGDGANAGRMAALSTEKSTQLDGASITEFYSTIAASIAVDGAAVADKAEVAAAVASSLQQQKESISGVNLDEEAISLLKYERAFQGASRFVRVVDDLLNQLILLIR